MNGLKRLITNEPVVIVSLVQSIITLVVVFGVSVTDEQTAAILGFTTIALAFLARALVTPVAKQD